MGDSSQIRNRSRRNARISLAVRTILTQKRKKLIYFVTQKSYSIGKASSRLRIKLSTAKMIVKRYKQDGTFFEPKPRYRSKLEPSGSEEYQSNDDQIEEEQEEREIKIEQCSQIQQNMVKQEIVSEELPAYESNCPQQPTFPSWTFLLVQCPPNFDSYIIPNPTNFYPALIPQ